jgi:hypothetical protein
VTDSTDPSDEDVRRLLDGASALLGGLDEDGDGEPDGLVEPDATAGQEAPLLFERSSIVGGPKRKRLDRPQHRVARAGAKAVSPQTMARLMRAEGRGMLRFFDWLHNYYNANDKLDLRLRNPRAHHEIHEQRRNRTFISAGTLLLLALLLFASAGLVGLAGAAFVIFAAFARAGRGKDRLLDAEAGDDIGMGETRIQRAVARAVFGVDLSNEKYRDWWRNIIVREGWTQVVGSDTRTIRLGLPAPHSAAKAKAKERDIAAALDLTEQQVRIIADPRRENAGDFDLIVYNSNPWDIPATFSPIALEPRRTCIWDGIDFGIDIDRQPVRLDIVGKSMLIGGLPEMGKTTTALTIMTSVVLDPFVRIWVADAKGVDTAPLIPLAYRYIGASQEEMVKMLQELMAWGRQKLMALKEVRRVKFDRSLCAMYQQIDANHPLATVDVVYIDEARFYTNGAVDLQSRRIVSLLSQIIEMFRAVGIIVIVATQRPSVKNIPSEIRDLLRIRLAHACTTPAMSNTILGEGAAGQGFSATQFDEDQPGVSWLRVLKSFRQVRPHLTQDEQLEKACEEAWRQRSEVGTTPEAIDATMTSVPTLLLDIKAICDEREWKRVPTNVLLPLLAARSQEYDGMSATELSSRMGNSGVTPRPIGPWDFEEGEPGKNVRGYRLEWIEAAIERHKKETVQ